MIIDKIGYAEKYASLLPHLADALALIEAQPQAFEGKKTFEGGYVMYQTGTTRSEKDGDYEAHRKYIDVQLLAEGGEWLLWNRLEEMRETAPYDAQKDKLAINGEGSLVQLMPGMFAVMFPQDAHKACRHPEGIQPAEFAKYVIKLAI